MVGHDVYPVSDNWTHLVDEIIESVKQGGDGPVIALGHSLGGVLCLMASLKAPGLFSEVIMLDSPIIDHIKSLAVKMIKKAGYIDYITPARRTKYRREHWNSIDEVKEYLRSRKLFANFTESCLQDYIDFGLIKNNEGEYCLKFDRQIEYLIYRTLPHRLPFFMRKQQLPVTMIYGSQSNVVSWYDVLYMRMRWGVNTYKISGSHMFPFEHPKICVDTIKKVISE